MRLSEAIIHCEEVADNCAVTECEMEHRQLAEWLKELKQRRAEQRWIPCSERLPEEPNVYAVTDGNGNVVKFVFYNNEASREYWRRCVKAWMPLPEPYREEK